MIFGALYTNWTLAAVVQNLVGFPSDGTRLAQMLWVFYFIGKRSNLLML